MKAEKQFFLPLSLIKSTYKNKWKWRFISCITSICGVISRIGFWLFGRFSDISGVECFWEYFYHGVIDRNIFFNKTDHLLNPLYHTKAKFSKKNFKIFHQSQTSLIVLSSLTVDSPLEAFTPHWTLFFLQSSVTKPFVGFSVLITLAIYLLFFEALSRQFLS